MKDRIRKALCLQRLFEKPSTPIKNGSHNGIAQAIDAQTSVEATYDRLLSKEPISNAPVWKAPISGRPISGKAF